MSGRDAIRDSDFMASAAAKGIATRWARPRLLARGQLVSYRFELGDRAAVQRRRLGRTARHDSDGLPVMRATCASDHAHSLSASASSSAGLPDRSRRLAMGCQYEPLGARCTSGCVAT